MIYCLNKKSLSKQIPNHVKNSSIAINKVLIGRIDKAEKIWDKIIVTNNEYSEPLFWKGLIQLWGKNDSTAISYIDKAISIDPTVASYYFTKAGIYQRLGKINLAIENYKMYIQLKPMDLYGYYYLAEL